LAPSGCITLSGDDSAHRVVPSSSIASTSNNSSNKVLVKVSKILDKEQVHQETFVYSNAAPITTISSVVSSYPPTTSTSSSSLSGFYYKLNVTPNGSVIANLTNGPSHQQSHPSQSFSQQQLSQRSLPPLSPINPSVQEQLQFKRKRQRLDHLTAEEKMQRR